MIDTQPTDLSHPPLRDGKIAIQRLPIHLPGFTSLTKFEPRYVFPLYKAMWKFRDPKSPVHDSQDTVRILDAYPAGVSWTEAWLIIDEDMAIESEAARLNAQFGLHPKNGERLFDVVYPGDAFERAFQQALTPSTSIKTSPTANPELDAIASLEGIGRGLAAKLYERGIRSVRDVALASDEELAKILGKTRGPKAKASAEAVFETPAA